MVDVLTGEIKGTPLDAMARKMFTVTVENPSGRAIFELGLEVQQHVEPELEYDSALRADTELYTVYSVGERVRVVSGLKVGKYFGQA